MGGSSSKEEKEKSESVVVSGQANVTIGEHDRTQYWLLGFLFFVFFSVFIMFVICAVVKVVKWAKAIEKRQARMEVALAELNATRK